tara:strand:+ start:427 stop:1461 length:1035 start_codon:yes stop_codon:yes gene_type:complete
MIYINLLIIFLLIITIHEFGHYFAARLFKAEVTDFSIGFGKSIYEFVDRNNTKWKISIIPLGGYVKIKGLDTIFQKQINIDPQPGTFQSLNLFKKIIVLIAGSFFNLISAWIAIFSILYLIGITTFSNEVGSVVDNSPAYINDIKKGDVIISVNSIKIKEFTDIPKAINGKKFIEMELLRENNIINKSFELEYSDQYAKYIIGISSTPDQIIKRFNFIRSFAESIKFIPNYYKTTILYLKNSIKKNTITQELSGPIGMVKMADKLMLDKVKGVIFLFVVISLFVGMFNLVPIPLLDGGHIVYFIIRHIFNDSLPNLVTRIYLITGLTIISFIFIVVTFNDIFYK